MTWPSYIRGNDISVVHLAFSVALHSNVLRTKGWTASFRGGGDKEVVWKLEFNKRMKTTILSCTTSEQQVAFPNEDQQRNSSKEQE